MKFASVTFNHLPNQIGGGHVPAVAFKEWCGILGHECDILDFSEGNVIKGYDAVFYCTPPLLDTQLPLDGAPYVVMIHSEFDDYRRSIMDGAKAVIIIDRDDKHWDFNNRIYWHPCCRPKYLLHGGEVFNNDREGTLYAARVSTWKNANTLAAFSNLKHFKNMFGPVKIYGKANNSEFGNFVHSAKQDTLIFDALFTNEELEDEYKSNEWFWDVSGTNEYKLEIKRLNLAAFEAMKFGCIPIVDKDCVPPEIMRFALDFRDVTDILSKWEVRNKRAEMLNAAKTEYFGYNAVKKQVEQIIRVMENV